MVVDEPELAVNQNSRQPFREICGQLELSLDDELARAVDEALQFSFVPGIVQLDNSKPLGESLRHLELWRNDLLAGVVNESVKPPIMSPDCDWSESLAKPRSAERELVGNDQVSTQILKSPNPSIGSVLILDFKLFIVNIDQPLAAQVTTLSRTPGAFSLSINVVSAPLVFNLCSRPTIFKFLNPMVTLLDDEIARAVDDTVFRTRGISSSRIIIACGPCKPLREGPHIGESRLDHELSTMVDESPHRPLL